MTDQTIEHTTQNAEHTEVPSVDTVEKPKTVVVSKDGKQYEVSGPLADMISRVLAEVEGQETGSSIEDADQEASNVIFCVTIDQVTDEDVQTFAGLISNPGELILYAVNPGKAKRTAAMEALERLAEENDVDVYHTFDPLKLMIEQADPAYVIEGPLAQTVQTALTQQEPAEEQQESDESAETDDGSESE